ncbi:MAG: Haloalkane dehalogenase [Bacteroidetes bacterium ADurb.Bin217]|nr:MAG: Haloalkane dehalogenase [Bacteroidetes bacterium ADurb.Bin217]
MQSTSNIFERPLECKLQGNTIRYYREGSGPVVLCIHGITTYSFIWRKIAPAFTSSFDVIIPDLLGCGDSSKPLHEDISLKRQATLLADFCSHIGVSQVHLVCHDVGGGIGQIFAVQSPHMVCSLTLINTVAYNFWPVQPIIAMRTPIIRQIAMASLNKTIFEIIVRRGLFHKDACTKELMDLFWQPMTTSIGRKAFLHFAHCLDNSNLTSITHEISALSIPVLIIRGDADVYLSSNIAESLHSAIPHSTYVCIPTAGHFIQEDEPELVAQHCLQHLHSAL